MKPTSNKVQPVRPLPPPPEQERCKASATTSCSARVEFEFQYWSADQVWEAGSFEHDEGRALDHLSRMSERFPHNRYRLIRRTIVEEVIPQNVLGHPVAPRKSDFNLERPRRRMRRLVRFSFSRIRLFLVILDDWEKRGF